MSGPFLPAKNRIEAHHLVFMRTSSPAPGRAMPGIPNYGLSNPNT